MKQRIILIFLLVFSIHFVYGQIQEVKRGKVCSTCKVTKPTSEFSGNSSICKSCVSKAEAERKRRVEEDRKAREAAEKQRLANEQKTREFAEQQRKEQEAAELEAMKQAFNLGVDFLYGQNGKPQDYTEAFRWFRKAAEMGNTNAYSILGLMYQNGDGVAQNYAEAFEWYRKAAEQGDEIAQNSLGNMYQNGDGVAQNYAEAVKWYRMAAEQGYAKAQTNLGLMYNGGTGVTQNYSEAAKWFRKAAEQEDAAGQYSLGYIYYYGEGVNKSVSDAEYWLKKAADQGFAGELTDIVVGFKVKLFVYTMEKGKQEPVIGATVRQVDKNGKFINNQGAITDLNGNSTLTLKKGDRVQISYVGYKNTTVTIGEEAKTQIVKCLLK